MLRSVVSRYCSLSLLLAFGMVCSPAVAQGNLSPAEARNLYAQASEAVFDAAVELFRCLAEGKREPGQYDLQKARDLLQKARTNYMTLRMNRGDTIFRPLERTELPVVSKIVAGLGDVPARTEADIAAINIMAIDQLTSQIAGWRNCSQAGKSLQQILRFFENKITLERATQLAEIAWAN